MANGGWVEPDRLAEGDDGERVVDVEAADQLELEGGGAHEEDTWIGERVEVAMPGGALTVEVSGEFDLQITGEVRRVASGEVAAELFGE